MIRLGFHSNDRLSKWENGHQLPSLINLFKLAKINGVLPGELFPSLAENP